MVVLFTIFYVGWADSNSLWERHYRWQNIKDLKKEISKLQVAYEEDTKKQESLMNDPMEVERVARETYYMTRPGEDLFIIQTDMTQPAGSVESEDTDDEMPVV